MKLIPDYLKGEFIEYMRLADKEDLSDNEWLAALEEEAWKFMKKHKINGDSNLAMHQYLIERSKV